MKSSTEVVAKPEQPLTKEQELVDYLTRNLASELKRLDKLEQNLAIARTRRDTALGLVGDMPTTTTAGMPTTTTTIITSTSTFAYPTWGPLPFSNAGRCMALVKELNAEIGSLERYWEKRQARCDGLEEQLEAIKALVSIAEHRAD
jgi:predicted RNase H-like nuclease (RuvC/YqgF family)